MKTEEGETQVETTPAEAMEIENGIEIPFEKARVLKGHDSEVCMCGHYKKYYIYLFLYYNILCLKLYCFRNRQKKRSIT